jgi:hypothetical protein
MAIWVIHPPCTRDDHCSVVWTLKHGCWLRGDRGRERETEWMTTFVWCPAKMFDSKNWRQNNPGSNGWEETSPGPLLLMIKVTYIIKNKLWKTDLISQEYSWYTSGSIVIWNQLARPWYPGWWGLLYSWCCMKHMFFIKLFNMVSPKFGERCGTNMKSIEAAHGQRSVIANGLGDKRLYYKKKTMPTKVTREINSFYLTA